MNKTIASSLLALSALAGCASAPRAPAACNTIASCNAEAEASLSDYAIPYYSLLRGWQIARRSGYIAVPDTLRVVQVDGRDVMVRDHALPPDPLPLHMQLPDFSKGGTIALRFYLNSAETFDDGAALYSLYTRLSESRARSVFQLGRVGRSMAIGKNWKDDVYWIPLWDPPADKARTESWVTVFVRFLPGSNKALIDVFSEKGGAIDRYSSVLDNGLPVSSYPSERQPKEFERIDGLMFFGYNAGGFRSYLDYINELRVYSTALTEQQMLGVAATRYLGLKSVGPENAACNTGEHLTYDVPVRDNGFMTLCGPRRSPFPLWINGSPQTVQWLANADNRALAIGANDKLGLEPRELTPGPAQKWRVELVNNTSNNARVSIASGSRILYLTAADDYAYLAEDKGTSPAQYWHYDYWTHSFRNLFNGKELYDVPHPSGVVLIDPRDNKGRQGAWYPSSLGPAAANEGAILVESEDSLDADR